MAAPTRCQLPPDVGPSGGWTPEPRTGASRGRTRAPVEPRRGSPDSTFLRSGREVGLEGGLATASGCLLSAPERLPVERDGPTGALGHLAEGPDGPPELWNGGVPVERPLDGGVPPRPDGAVEGNALTDP